MNRRAVAICLGLPIGLFFLGLFLLAVWVVKTEYEKRYMLADVITGLTSSDSKIQDAASDKLRKFSKDGLSVEDGITALTAAAKSFPARKLDCQDSAEDLVDAAAVSPKPEYVPVIVEHFSRYSQKAKKSSLDLLAKLPQSKAAVAYMALVRKHARQGEISHLSLGSLYSEPRHADVFFPEILQYTDINGLEDHINILLVAYLRAGLVKPETIAWYSDKILESYVALEKQLMPLQQSSGVSWMSENGYQESRFRASLHLDILGYFGDERALGALCRATSYSDQCLKGFAVLGLIRQGQTVPEQDLVGVAAFAESRDLLYDGLSKLGKTALFPKQFNTQAAFAESNMVNWLVFPGELGRVPDEIEPMHVATFDTHTDDGLVEYYVFRFRTLEPHRRAKDGWMAGVSGPFIKKDAPSPIAHGDPFSDFEPWDSKTPEQHLGAVRETLKDWRTHHGKEPEVQFR